MLELHRNAAFVDQPPHDLLELHSVFLELVLEHVGQAHDYLGAARITLRQRRQPWHRVQGSRSFSTASRDGGPNLSPNTALPPPAP
jgi:hypothetical protein